MVLFKEKSAAFRSDINGLRAWAVAAVVLYHFSIPGFSGGFIGVDVFFVISGFLMTGIIVNGLEKENANFSILQFYIARARRILPALIALCSVLMIAGWFWLLPLDYNELQSQVFYAITFISNIKFWQQAGYFDTSAHEKWLLHTWSLSVEWQFYLVLPLVLFLIWQIRPDRKLLTKVLITTAIVSFVLCVLSTTYYPDAAFYFFPTRAWQMLSGGLIFLLDSFLPKSTRLKNLFEISGFLLIASAVFIFNTDTSWPGWRSIVPVLGTMLILISNQSHSYWNDNFLAQWLGTRSYSIYLWHWPLVVALVYINKFNDSVMQIAGLLLTLILGQLSFIFIENNARRFLSKKSSTLNVCYFALLIFFVISIGFIPQVIDESTRAAESEQLNKNPRTTECQNNRGIDFKSCLYGGNELKAIVVGDSHANAIINSIKNALPDDNFALKFMGKDSCPTLSGAIWRKSTEIKCLEFNEWLEDQINAIDIDIPLIIINRTTLYAKGFTALNAHPLVFFTKNYNQINSTYLNEFHERLVDTACKYAKQRTVYLLRPIPEMPFFVPQAFSRGLMRGEVIDISITLDDYNRRHAFVWAAQDDAARRCGVKILDPLPFLCTEGKCSGTRNGRPIYFDNNHLSEYGNRFLVPLFTPIFSH